MVAAPHNCFGLYIDTELLRTRDETIGTTLMPSGLERRGSVTVSHGRIPSATWHVVEKSCLVRCRSSTVDVILWLWLSGG